MENSTPNPTTRDEDLDALIDKLDVVMKTEKDLLYKTMGWEGLDMPKTFSVKQLVQVVGLCDDVGFLSKTVNDISDSMDAMGKDRKRLVDKPPVILAMHVGVSEGSKSFQSAFDQEVDVIRFSLGCDDDHRNFCVVDSQQKSEIATIIHLIGAHPPMPMKQLIERILSLKPAFVFVNFDATEEWLSSFEASLGDVGSFALPRFYLSAEMPETRRNVRMHMARRFYETLGMSRNLDGENLQEALQNAVHRVCARLNMGGVQNKELPRLRLGSGVPEIVGAKFSFGKYRKFPTSANGAHTTSR